MKWLCSLLVVCCAVSGVAQTFGPFIVKDGTITIDAPRFRLIFTHGCLTSIDNKLDHTIYTVDTADKGVAPSWGLVAIKPGSAGGQLSSYESPTAGSTCTVQAIRGGISVQYTGLTREDGKRALPKETLTLDMTLDTATGDLCITQRGEGAYNTTGIALGVANLRADRSIEGNERVNVGIGFMAICTSSGSPLVIPPSMPPAWLVLRTIQFSSGYSASCTCEPGSAAAANPRPTSTPLMAGILMSAAAICPSKRRSQWTWLPNPTGIPVAIIWIDLAHPRISCPGKSLACYHACTGRRHQTGMVPALREYTRRNTLCHPVRQDLQTAITAKRVLGTDDCLRYQCWGRAGMDGKYPGKVNTEVR